jgi:hypothetical protein
MFGPQGARSAPVEQLRKDDVDRLHDGEDSQSPPPEVPATPSPSQETTMPKTKRGPRVSSQAANTAVEAALTDTGRTVEVIAIAAALTPKATQKALGRLRRLRLATFERSGKSTLWLKGKTAAAATDVRAAGAGGGGGARTTPMKSLCEGLTRKFGYFNDGAVSINCESCKGELTAAELKEFRAFAEEHVK